MAMEEVLAQGCWTPLERFSASGGHEWSAGGDTSDGGSFQVLFAGEPQGEVNWELSGVHSVNNALAAIAAARHAGVPVNVAIEALSTFRNVKRRMELRGEVGGVRVYDDFAHHPTAIETTLRGLRARVGAEPITAVLEPRSNTMRMGVHAAQLPASLEQADRVLVYSPPHLDWDAAGVFSPLGDRAGIYRQVEDMVTELARSAVPGEHVLIMSNGGFENIHQRLLDALAEPSSEG